MVILAESVFNQVPIDQVEDFWNRRPCNIRHSPKPVGSREYFDEVDARRYFVEPHILRFAQFERWRGKRVLEIGCGIGTDTNTTAGSGSPTVGSLICGGLSGCIAVYRHDVDDDDEGFGHHH